MIRTVTGRSPGVARQAIVAGMAVVLGLVVAVGPAAADVLPPGGAAAQSMTLTSSTPVVTVGTSVLTIEVRDGFTLVGSSFDIFVCPDTTFAPVDTDVNADEEKGDCLSLTFWGRTDGNEPNNVEANATSRAVKENALTMSWLIDFEESDSYFVYDSDPYDEPVPGLEENFFDDVCVVEGLYVIVHDYLGERQSGSQREGLHSNFVGPLRVPGCSSETDEVDEVVEVVSAGDPLELVCTPDPVVPGGTVTCEVSGGSAGFDILWQASFGSVFASQGVTLGADGRGSFSFVAPRGAAGQSVSVELVQWLRPLDVQVSGSLVPARVPAGEGSGALPFAFSAALLLVASSGVLRLRRASAVS
jgi:hypothetical protein